MRKRKTSDPDIVPQQDNSDASKSPGDIRVVKLSSAIWLTFGVVIGSTFGGPWVQDLIDLGRGYRWNYLDRCIMETPEDTGYGVDFCRAPVDCQLCRDVHKIDEISVENLSVEVFEDRYAYSGRPLVVRNATLDWPLMDVLDYNWLKEIYLSEPEMMAKTGDDCWFNRYKTLDLRNLRSVFHMPGPRAAMKAGKPWYVGWSVCHEKVAEEMFQLFSRPSFISPDSSPPKKPWIFIGTPKNGAHFHVDNVDLSSWQVQITGSKTWYLEPPPECYWSCPGRIEATLYPGDILVVDTNRWFHATKVHPGGLSISMVNEFD